MGIKITYTDNEMIYRSDEIKIGHLPVGGIHPVRIQSMTTTNTLDTKATVAQCLRMAEKGCEMIRITTPSIREAKNLSSIKEALLKRGIDIPLIADIHFTPKAAEIAAGIVEKVRINPGNYADKKKFVQKTYSKQAYRDALQKMKDRLLPLIEICKKHRTVIRIGTNHGSLSDRIMNRFGDTPLGMVESALEFARICREEGFNSIVLSMKSSNPLVMMEANRLLISKMLAEGMHYPIHLGVTEAGGGIHGRIKSAIGIGILLSEGIGDTIRVSLTEEPENELPFASILARKYGRRQQTAGRPADQGMHLPAYTSTRTSKKVLNIGGGQLPVVICDLSGMRSLGRESLMDAGYRLNDSTADWLTAKRAADYIFTADMTLQGALPHQLHVICHYDVWLKQPLLKKHFPLLSASDYLTNAKRSDTLNLIDVDSNSLQKELFQAAGRDDTAVFLLGIQWSKERDAFRLFFQMADEAGCRTPVIIKYVCDESGREPFIASASTETGALLIRGYGDGIFLRPGKSCSSGFAKDTAFGILQASRLRISETEFISCPSCGRTLFDIQKTTAIIRSRTAHLKGLKIGIMGCIVNGPGEMSDANYGYVGTGHGLITLYKGKEVVQRNIPERDAVEALIKLIKQNNDWVNP